MMAPGAAPAILSRERAREHGACARRVRARARSPAAFCGRALRPRRGAWPRQGAGRDGCHLLVAPGFQTWREPGGGGAYGRGGACGRGGAGGPLLAGCPRRPGLAGARRGGGAWTRGRASPRASIPVPRAVRSWAWCGLRECPELTQEHSLLGSLEF